MQSLIRFLAPPGPCEFLPDRVRRLEYEIVRELAPDEYLERMRTGWRRFGHAMFRHVCPSCRACQSLRVPVDAFRSDRSQARVWKANYGQVQLVVGPPSASPEKQALFLRFHEFQRQLKGWPAQTGEETGAFLENPFATEEWCYFLGTRLVGVGYVDNLSEGLSAIYFYYDPDERRRSLGTFNVLSVIEAARRLGRPYAYLGYYVRGCRSLEYKARFRPSEVLDADGRWTSFSD